MAANRDGVPADERENKPPPFRSLVALSLRGVFWPSLLVAPAIAVVLAVAIVKGWFHPTKQTLETIGLAVPTLAAAVAAGRALATREPFFLWATLLAGNFAVRELDAPGYTDLVYVGLALLLLFAWRRYESLGPYLADRTVLTLLACTFFTYSLSATLDLQWWKFLPHEAVFEMLLEEAIEIAGHVQLLALVVFARPCDRSIGV